MTARRGWTLRGRLVAWSLLSTLASLVVFAFTAVAVIVLQEKGESAHEPSGSAVEHEVPPAAEATGQILVALALAAPIGTALGVGGSILLARRGLSGIETVIRTAATIETEDLGTRIPVPEDPREIRELAEALNRVLHRLQIGFGALGRFAADASHELRTPLAVMRMELEVALRRERTSEEWRTVATRAHGEVLRLSRLVEALLVLARAEPQPEHRDPLANVDDVLEQVAHTAGVAAEAGDVRVSLEGVRGLSARIPPESLRSAITNLVLNAIRFSPKGGVVRVTTHADPGKRVSINVEDEGPGVSVAMRARIFDPFWRGPDERGDGFGLGLTIAQRLLVASGGTIAVTDRTEMQGARFVVTLRGDRARLR